MDVFGMFQTEDLEKKVINLKARINRLEEIIKKLIVVSGDTGLYMLYKEFLNEEEN